MKIGPVAWILCVTVVAGLPNDLCAQQSADILRRASFSDPVFVGTITNPAIIEASGLACSRRRDDVLWVLNDSGNLPALYAVTTCGVSIASFTVEGATNHDWEDMASFVLDGRPFLLIGDVGDNESRRDKVSLYVVEEPDLQTSEASDTASLPIAWKIRFRYEDGPRDCESVSVSPATESVLLLSKRTQPPTLYEVPLRPTNATTAVTAIRVVAVQHIPAPTEEDQKERWGKFNSQPTACDLSVDGTRLVVLTYKDAYLYMRRHDSTWAMALATVPERIILPARGDGVMLGRESLCFDRDSESLYVTSEGSRPPLCRLDPASVSRSASDTRAKRSHSR